MEQTEFAPIRMMTLGAILAAANDESPTREIGVTLNRIYFLFLGGVKKALKPADWKSKQAVIHAATTSCLRHGTAPDDVCAQISDEQYILVFQDDDLEVIAGRCKRIADALEQRLFGERGRGRVVIRDAARVFADGSIHTREVSDDLADAAASLLRSLPEADDACADRFGSVFSASAREARTASLLETLDSEQDQPLVYSYLPMWHTREGRIATYICRPQRGTGPAAEYGYVALGEEPTASACTQFDTYGLEECLFALKKLVARKSPVNLMASVHFETLAQRVTRAKLHAFLAAVPKRYRGFLSLHLAEIPTGIPDSRLQEITANLNGWVRNLVVSLKMSECPTLQVLTSRAHQFARSRIGVVNVDFEGHSSREKLGRAKALSNKLARSGLVFAASNVSSRDDLCELSTSSYVFLGGRAVGDARSEPAPSRGFTMRDLERPDTHEDNEVYL